MNARPRGAGRGARDPRTIVTPEAFTIAPDLLGLPLASPSRRLAAILVDLVVIGILALLTRSFFFVVFLVVAALLLRASYRGLRDTDFVGTAFRISVGCLGFVLLVAALAAAVLFAVGRDDGEADPDAPDVVEPAPAGSDAAAREPRLRDLGRGGLEALRFRRASTADEAARAGAALARELRLLGVDRSGAAELLRETVPPTAPWAAGAPGVIESALAEAGFGADTTAATPPGAPGAEGEEPTGAVAAADEQVAPDTAVDTDAAPDGAAEGGPAALPDTVQALARLLEEAGERAAALEEELAEEERARERAEEEAREAQGRGGFGWLRDLVDQLGFGFGWAAVYFTLILPWTNGQTVGKRLLGIRVVQLDGSPMNWWEAFERSGGYAAGFATGLLGFAQVYWDPNRQAIHDKVAGTVVVLDGLPPVPGPWRRSGGTRPHRGASDEPPPSPPPPDPIRRPPGPSSS